MERMNLFGDSKPKVNTKPKKKEHSKEFKELAVNLASKIGVTKAAEELGISASSIYSWKKILNTSTLAKTPAPIQDDEGNLTFSLEDHEYSLNVNSEEEREVVKEEINSNTLAKYNWFREESGKRHWVLYNTEMYEVKETLTHDKYIHYKENSNLAPIIPINATSCLFMFRNCWRLESLDLSNFDTSQVTEMGGMFFWCVTLKSLNLSFFNTSKVTSMFNMFRNCYSLTQLDVSNFNTSKVISMNAMFSGCSKLTSLDLSSFNTSKITNIIEMICMFERCNSLTSIYISDKWKTNRVDSFKMFEDCYSLPNFNEEKIDAEMAKPVEQGGYLILK